MTDEPSDVAAAYARGRDVARESLLGKEGGVVSAEDPT